MHELIGSKAKPKSGGAPRSDRFTGALLEAVADRYLGPKRTAARTVEFGIGVIVLKAVATGVFLLLLRTG